LCLVPVFPWLTRCDMVPHGCPAPRCVASDVKQQVRFSLVLPPEFIEPFTFCCGTFSLRCVEVIRMVLCLVPVFPWLTRCDMVPHGCPAPRCVASDPPRESSADTESSGSACVGQYGWASIPSPRLDAITPSRTRHPASNTSPRAHSRLRVPRSRFPRPRRHSGSSRCMSSRV